MEEKDPSLMSFPSIPSNFISLQELQQLRLQEKEDANKKKEDEVRVTSLKREEENQNKVTDKPIASNRFYNHKQWYKGGREEVRSLKTVEPVDFEKSKKGKEKEEEIKKPTTSNGFNNHKKCYKGGREEIGLLNTVEPIDFEKSKKGKEKEEKEDEITKPTTFNRFNNKKKWQNERRIRNEEVGFLKTHETVDFEESNKSKEKEKEENQEKLHEESFNGVYKKNVWNKGEIGLGSKSSEEIDLEKAEKKKRKYERKKRWKKKKNEEWKLRKKLDRQGTLVDEKASNEKEIKSIEGKDDIYVNSTVEIVVDDDDNKKKTKMKEEVNGDLSWRIKKQPSIAAAATVLSNPTSKIVQKFDVIRVFGTDQKGKNRRSAVGMNRGFGAGFRNRRNARGRGGDDNEKNQMWVNRGFGGGFENRRNAKGRGGDDNENNLMWVKKGENLNSGGNPS